MAAPQIVTVREFTSSRYAELAEDLPIGDILARAESAVIGRLSQNIKPATYIERFIATADTIFTKRRPIISITQIRYRLNHHDAWQIAAADDFHVEGGPGYVEFYHGIRGYEVEITYTAGLDPVPEALKEAIIMQAVLLSFTDTEVYGAGDAKQPGILYMQEDVDRLLRPFVQTSTVYH